MATVGVKGLTAHFLFIACCLVANVSHSHVRWEH